MLTAKQLTEEQRETAGIILTLIAALTTVGQVLEAFGQERHPLSPGLTQPAGESGDAGNYR